MRVQLVLSVDNTGERGQDVHRLRGNRILKRVNKLAQSLAAAPAKPDTRPPHSRRAVSISSFSVETGILDNCGWLCSGCARGCRESQLLSTEKVSVSLTMTERSITFCSSRILPGQGYDWSRSRLFLSTALKVFPAFRAKR